jgi:hypothetical protein
MRICREDRSTQNKRVPVPLCSPQILHSLTRDRTWATELSGGGSRSCSEAGVVVVAVIVVGIVLIE